MSPPFSSEIYVSTLLTRKGSDAENKASDGQ